MNYYRPEDVAPPRATYTHAIRVRGQLIFVSGQVPVDVDGNLVGRDDVRLQAEQVFHNPKRVLAFAGAGFEHVVKMTAFVVGRRHVDAFRRFRGELFEELYPSGDYPTTTFLVVDGLASPDFLVEIEAIAALEE